MTLTPADYRAERDRRRPELREAVRALVRPEPPRARTERGERVGDVVYLRRRISTARP